MSSLTCIVLSVICLSTAAIEDLSRDQNIKTNDDILNALDYDHRSIWSSNEESCSSGQGVCARKPADVAEKLIQDLYLTIKEAANNLSHPSHYPPHYSPQDGEEFDFIVVGAGSAGSVVANRLTEVYDWRVLLVEAGGNPTLSSEIPRLFSTLQSTDVDWKYQTDPEENVCLGMVDNRCNWPRGKVLGGSSTINYMMYVRGNAKDYDSWAKAGNTGWNYDEVLPYFKKSEDIRAHEVLETEDVDKYHGRGGNLKIESWLSAGEESAMNPVIEGMAELGYFFNPDCNGKNQTGFTKVPGTLEAHKRCSTVKAFLSTIKNRTNLQVSKNSFVTKILIDKDSSRAYGVEFTDKNGKNITVKASKEVILSAGAVNSPQLLMLSGVGPKQHLLNLGLPVVKDLPVGENLQDHPLMGSLAVTIDVPNIVSKPIIQSMFDFLINGSSLLSTLLPIGYAGFINTIEGVDYPDMELLQGHFGKNEPQELIMMLESFNYKKDVIDEFVKINENAYTIILFGSMLRPFSRGRILLQSPDPRSHPKLVTGYFSDRRDIETFLRTYEFISRLVDTKAMKSVNAKLHEIRLPACEKHAFSSPEYRECSLRHLTSTTYHFSGSCKMGPFGDPKAVVDPTLRVMGLQGLRVVDASIIPTIPSGHINAAVIMIAEKASDLIKSSWS